MASVLDYTIFTPTELAAMLTAFKAEYLARGATGTVRQGGSAAQQYSMDKMSTEELIAAINGIAAALGLGNQETVRAAPNFNNRGSQSCGGFGY